MSRKFLAWVNKMFVDIKMRTTCGLLAALLFCSTTLLAQDGTETFSEQDAGEVERMQTFTKRGAAYFATSVQGETYTELSGKIGHRAVDLSIRANGLLGYSATRVFEEIPQQYPYEMGTMSLSTPHLLFEPIYSPTQVPDVVSCRDWRANGAEVYNTIKFNHENGMVEFIHKDIVHPDILESNYPGNALYISKDNWYLECTGNTEGVSKFLVYSPTGAVYVINPVNGERYRSTRLNNGSPVPLYKYKIFVESKRRYNSVLTYVYEPAPGYPNASVSTDTNQVRPPMFLRANPRSPLSVFKQRQIFNKRRLLRVELSVSDEESVEDTAREKQFVYFEYRETDDGCAGRLDRIHSTSSRVKEVRYKYTPLVTGNQGTVCQLSAVENEFHVNEGEVAQSQTIWRFAYRFRDGQTFLGGAGGSSNPTYWYLPLKSVETPTATKVTYDYDVMGICQYQSVSDKNSGSTCGNYAGTNGQTTSGRSSPRRPIVTKRIVADKYDSATPKQTTNIEYDNRFVAFTVSRTITDENVSHVLTFGRPDHYSEPAGVTYESLNAYIPESQRVRFENSGRLLIYELRRPNDTEPFVRIEHIYKEHQSFIRPNRLTAWDKENTFTTGRHRYLYTQRWINPFSTVIRKEGHVYEKQYLSYDAYNNLTRLQEITRLNGAANEEPGVFRRITDYEYDNDYARKAPAVGHFWFVGAISRSSVDSGESEPLVSAYKYNDLGLVSEAVEAGFKKNYIYYRNGNVAQIVNSDNSRIQFSEYKRGVAELTINGNGESHSKAIDTFGNVTESTDALNSTIKFEYKDRYKRRTRTIRNEGVSDEIVVYPEWINVSSVNFRKKREIQGNLLKETHYDHQRNMLKVEVEDTVTPSGARIVLYDYDVTSRLISRSDPHLANQPVVATTYGYDPFGRVIVSAHTSDGAPTKYCYGPACNSNNEFTSAGSVSVVDGYAVRDKAGYVTISNFISYGEPSYDWLTETSQQIDASEAVITSIDRNKVGFIKRVTQSSSNSELSRTRIYTPYTKEGETTTLLSKTEVHPEFTGTRTVTSYDAVGNPKTVKDFDGSEIEYIYDPAYRLRFALYKLDASPDSPGNTNNIEYVYYPNGLVKDVIHGGSTWSYEYDNNNLLIAESLSIDNLAESFDLSYTYDNLMNLNLMTYPSGRVVDYNHNAFGETTRISGYLASANYHASGQLAQAEYENGQVFSSTQDDKQRPENWSLIGFNGQPVFDMNYGFDVRDNVARITSYFNGGNQGGTPYSLNGLDYDGLSRLTEANGEWSAGLSSAASYEYNALGDITNKMINGVEHTYNYHPSLGRLTYVSTSASSFGTRLFSYDLRGNVTGNSVDQFSYNQINQMVEVKVVAEDGATGTKYVYDGNAMRVKTITTKYNAQTNAVEDTGATYHVYNLAGQMAFEMELGSAETRDHVFFNGNRLATRVTHNRFDSDADGIPDYYERLHGLDLHNPNDALGDADQDSLTNLFEYENGLLPTNTDSDFDGILDQFDEDTPPREEPSGTIVLNSGLLADPNTASVGESLTINFALTEIQGLPTTLDSLELWVLSADGNDLFQIQSPVLPSGILFMEPEAYKEFVIEIPIEAEKFVPGEYRFELRYQIADVLKVFDATGGNTNPVAVVVKEELQSSKVGIEPIINFLLD